MLHKSIFSREEAVAKFCGTMKVDGEHSRNISTNRRSSKSHTSRNMTSVSKLIAFVAVLVFTGCTLTPKSYIIEGVVPDSSYNNKMAYIYDYENNECTDSVLIVDEKFQFTGSVDIAVLRGLEVNRPPDSNRLYANIILENGKISVDMADPKSAKGTPLNDELSKYNAEMAVFQKALMDKLNEIKQLDDETREKQIEIIDEKYFSDAKLLLNKFFIPNKNNAAGAFVLLNNDYSRSDIDMLDSLYALAGDIVRNDKRLQRVVATNAIKRQTSEGMHFVDFTIENGNSDGSMASLSDYVGKGKYVLVDFWASWCVPCIGEVPVLQEVYAKYKGDKFELLGVAVWEEREATERYLEVNNSLWPQIIEANDIPTKLYGINGIPHIILFGPDGKIIARNLRGNGLKAKVAEVMQ
jgi:thiol-disulfide isomerase/thioredoxin